LVAGSAGSSSGLQRRALEIGGSDAGGPAGSLAIATLDVEVMLWEIRGMRQIE